jgi:formate-dependent nitrite reductase cytochrome c552 subunit
MINLILTIVSFSFVNSNEVPMNLRPRPLAPRANECQLCHIKRTNRENFVPKKNSTKSEHGEIVIVHGSLKKACNDCHDVNNSDKLMSPGTFEDTSLLCSRCHIERYREWQKGIHGKKISSWQNYVVFHCIDCHNPHDVSFKKMESRPGPENLRH